MVYILGHTFEYWEAFLNDTCAVDGTFFRKVLIIFEQNKPKFVKNKQKKKKPPDLATTKKETAIDDDIGGNNERPSAAGGPPAGDGTDNGNVDDGLPEEIEDSMKSP